MKITHGLLLAGLLLTGRAWAQGEQWLQYHTDSQGKASRVLSITTTPPAGVALPKFNAQPYFARWTTPMDTNGGRWMALDRRRQSGPYDLLYIDSTGNGRLDDKKPVVGSPDSSRSVFPAIPLTFKGEDGPITYHLAFWAYQLQSSSGNDSVELVVMSAGWYEGTVNFGGQKKHVQLLDANLNGAFDDLDANPFNGDRLVVDGEPTPEHYLAPLIEVGGKLFHLEVAHDGAFIKVKPAENIAFGSVHVPDTISEFVAYSKDTGHFVRKPVNGSFTLPEGQYRMVSWLINRKDDKGVSWSLQGHDFPDSAGFEVAAGRTAELQIGEPFQARLSASTNTVDGQVTFDLSFVGSQKEGVQLLREGQRPSGPKLTLLNADGSVCSTSTFEFG
jgi:hypothetical protein